MTSNITRPPSHIHVHNYIPVDIPMHTYIYTHIVIYVNGSNARYSLFAASGIRSLHRNSC